MSIDHDSSPAGTLGLLAAAAAAVARDDPGVAIQAILDRANEAIGGLRAAVAARDPDGSALELAADVGFDDAQRAVGLDALADPTSPASVAMAERTATFDRPAAHDPAAHHADLPLVVAIDGVEQPVGLATFIYPASRSLSADDRALLLVVADLLATAVDRARLASMAVERAEWLERLAHIDPLTGLANARMLGRVLELEVARAGRQGGAVSVAVFDIDGFGAYNDQAGRAAGDDALRQVAEILGGSIRLVDTVARTGADEFVVVAPGSAGRAVAGRVIAAMASLQPAAGGGVSVSAGVAEFPRDGTSPDELLEVARLALDEARSGGSGRLGSPDGT